MPTAHLAVYDTLADWEPGYLLAELRTGRFTGVPFDVVTVAVAPEPVVTMGGVRILPDAVLDDVDPSGGDLLILSGSGSGVGADPFVPAARRCLDAGVPVAAICAGGESLARAGLLDDRRHTGGAREALAATGYAGGAHYVDERAVADRGLITAGPQSPVQWARATLAWLGLAAPEVLDAYEGVFHRGDVGAYGVLMSATGRA